MDLRFGSGDFCVEGFVYYTETSGNGTIIMDYGTLVLTEDLGAASKLNLIIKTKRISMFQWISLQFK